MQREGPPGGIRTMMREADRRPLLALVCPDPTSLRAIADLKKAAMPGATVWLRESGPATAFAYALLWKNWVFG